MTKAQRISLAILRIALGCFFFYSGLTKVLDPSWSALGYLENAQTFSSFYQTLTSPGILSFINIVNAWGQFLLGISLILGVGIRWSAPLGILLMLMYYFPILNFPYAGEHAFLIDDHILYATILTHLWLMKAEQFYGLENWCWQSIKKFVS